VFAGRKKKPFGVSPAFCLLSHWHIPFTIQTNKKALPFLTELIKFIPKYSFLF
jgi:hypothetical protein